MEKSTECILCYSTQVYGLLQLPLRNYQKISVSVYLLLSSTRYATLIYQTTICEVGETMMCCYFVQRSPVVAETPVTPARAASSSLRCGGERALPVCMRRKRCTIPTETAVNTRTPYMLSNTHTGSGRNVPISSVRKFHSMPTAATAQFHSFSVSHSVCLRLQKMTLNGRHVTINLVDFLAAVALVKIQRKST